MPHSERWALTNDLVDDVRFALRQLRSAAAFSIPAVATLSLGVGATTAVFSLLNAIVLRPMPFRDPAAVVALHPARDGVPIVTASGLEYSTWRALPRVFTATAAFIPQNALTLERGDARRVVNATRASADFMRTLGIEPILGRTFLAADDQPGAAHVVILTHSLWKSDFRGDSDVVGKTIRLDGEAYTVIGVMPRAIEQLAGGDALWLPLALTSASLQDFRARNLQLVARLGPGVSLQAATAAIDASERRLGAEYPMWGTGYSAQARLFGDDIVGNLHERLLTLFGAVLFVFLIACANVANLLLARGNARAGEMAIRTALGAPHARLVRQLLTESALLCLAAGLAGSGLAAALVHGIVAASPPGVPRMTEVGIDGTALVFTCALCTVCSLMVGLIPAFRVAGPDLQTSLRSGTRGAGHSRASERARSTLVGVEVALAMALLMGAALLIRTAWEVSRVDPGFETANVLTTQILLPATRFRALADGIPIYRAIREGVRATPGVVASALTSTLPLGSPLRAGVGAEGKPLIDGTRLIANLRLVSPGYFSAMKIGLHAGRDFATADGADEPNVAIINEALARRLWPGERNVVGKRIESMNPNHQHFMEVVGEIADTRDVGLDQPAAPEFYIPLEQVPDALWPSAQSSMTIVARTVTDAGAVQRLIRQAISSVDPSLPIASAGNMDEAVRSSRAGSRFNMLLLTVLGFIALSLASVGVYGVVAYSVSQRARELALRMALGASPLSIAAHVVRRGLSPVAVGTVVGIVLAVATSQLLRDQLYGVAPRDPSTIGAIAVLLILIAAIAAYVPARRAVRIQPATVLAE